MPNGLRRGRGFGGGMGFGFRGVSPPWPYVGLGRGGLPRGAYYYRGANLPMYQPAAGAPVTGYRPFSATASKEDELGYLKDQAEAVKTQLENIEARIRDIEAKE